MNWRLAIALGIVFVIIGAIYWVLPYIADKSKSDYEGFVLLTILGVAMAFGFTVLLRGSRDL